MTLPELPSLEDQSTTLNNLAYYWGLNQQQSSFDQFNVSNQLNNPIVQLPTAETSQFSGLIQQFSATTTTSSCLSTQNGQESNPNELTNNNNSLNNDQQLVSWTFLPSTTNENYSESHWMASRSQQNAYELPKLKNNPNVSLNQY